MTQPPVLTLNNGVTLPSLGFGVFRTPPDQAVQAVLTALDAGYRHIDTAAAYFNEREVGEAIRRFGLPRDEVFVETKVWVSDYGYDETLHAFDKATGKLGLDRIDLLILHQAAPKVFDQTIAAYRALEKLLADGVVRAIGVSNFKPNRLDTLLAETNVVPAVNQIELHPYHTQPDLQAYHAAHRIVTQAWSPIGGITFYAGYSDLNDRHSTLDDPVLAAIGHVHGKTPAQVMLRWHIQQGRSAIPKSVRPERIKENFETFDFTLTADESAQIDALDGGEKFNPEDLDFSQFGGIPEA
jgi:diketogulonate reductase-like aldo/keto reductase